MVSIIIPTYGGGEGVEKVIDSILHQTYRDIEIIVVDDNGKGTENQIKTSKTLKKFIDSNVIQYITPEKNQGGSAARNMGAKASRGKYLMFLDDDDTVSEDKIEKQVEALEKKGKKYGIAYCSSKVYANGELSNIILAKKSGDILYEYMMGKVYIGTGTALLLREAWESLGGYDESFVRHQDWEFFSRVLNKYYAIATPDTYFNRYITNRNRPQNIQLSEKYADHYIEFLRSYDFRLPQKKLMKVVNRNNSRVALAYVKSGDIKGFAHTIRKYDNTIHAFFSFVSFTITVCVDKLRGKKS